MDIISICVASFPFYLHIIQHAPDASHIGIPIKKSVIIFNKKKMLFIGLWESDMGDIKWS